LCFGRPIVIIQGRKLRNRFQPEREQVRYAEGKDRNRPLHSTGNRSLLKEVVMTTNAARRWLAAWFAWSLLGPVPGGRPEEPARFDRYGDPLPPGAIARLGTLRYRDKTGISCVALSPDGKILAVGTLDRVIRLLEAATGKELRRLNTGTIRAIRLTFCPGGKSLTSVEDDGLIRCWDVATGKELHRLEVGPRIKNIVVSADTKIMAGVNDPDGRGNQVYAWDLARGKMLGPFQVLQNQNVQAALSPTGDLLATWGDFHERESEQAKRREITKTIQLWKIATGKEIRRLHVPCADNMSAPIVSGAAFSPDGRQLATAGEPETIRVWDLATGQERRLAGRPELGSLLVFSPDGRFLASGTSSRRPADTDPIQLWETATGKHLGVFPVPPCQKVGLVFTPEGLLLGWGKGYSIVHLWDVRTGKMFGPGGGHAAPVSAVSFTPDGRRLISADLDSSVCSWEVAGRQELRRLTLKGRGGDFFLNPYKTVFSGNAKYLAAIKGLSDQLGVWEVASGRLVFPLIQTQSLTGIALSHDGALLAASREGGMVCLWDARTGKNIRQWQGPESTAWLHFAPDSKTLTAVSFHHDSRGQPRSPFPIEVHHWDLATGNLVYQFAKPGRSFHSASLAPDGRVLIVTGWKDDGFRLWDLPTGIELRTFGRGQEYQVNGPLVLSPDGRTLAVAGRENVGKIHTVQLWELASGQLRGAFPVNQEICGMAFSPDGRTLAAGCWDTTVVLWDVTSGLREKRPNGAVPSAEAIEALWSDLTGADARRSHRAVWELAAAPAQTVPFLRKHLRPVEGKPADSRIIARLIRDLEDDQFAVREQAMRQLETMGKEAQPALREALKNQPSLELRRRAEELLKKLERPEPALEVPVQRALEVLEHIGNGEARELLKILAAGQPHAPLTREAKASLERLARRPAALP
jgi:WD40 repeat protein